VTGSRPSKFVGMGAAFLAAGVVLAACATNAGSADSSTSTQPDPVATPVATTTTQPAPTTTIDDRTKVTVVEGEPYRQPNDGDPSTVDIYLTDTPDRPSVVLLHGWGFPGTVGQTWISHD